MPLPESLDCWSYFFRDDDSPRLVALIYRDGAGRAFTQTFFVALAIGSLLWWPNRRQKGELKSREGFLIVVLFWTVLGSVGALPFIFSEQPNLTVTDAFLNRSRV